MHTITIEKITSRQILQACASILVDAYNSEPWNDEWTPETAFRKLDCFYKSPDFIGLLAYQDGKLIGACVGNIEPYYTGDYFYLKEMFVSPEAQKLGVGKKLMESLKIQLAELGIKQVILFTSNEFFPFNFYEKAAFKVMEGMVMMHYESAEN